MMLIKTLTLHSLTYIAGVLTSMAVHHQVGPAPAATAGLRSDTTRAAIIERQIANSSAKSDRLPIREAKPQANDEAHPQVTGKRAPKPKFTTSCKPPIDVIGRCFADASAVDPTLVSVSQGSHHTSVRSNTALES